MRPRQLAPLIIGATLLACFSLNFLPLDLDGNPLLQVLFSVAACFSIAVAVGWIGGERWYAASLIAIGPVGFGVWEFVRRLYVGSDAILWVYTLSYLFLIPLVVLLGAHLGVRLRARTSRTSEHVRTKAVILRGCLATCFLIVASLSYKAVFISRPGPLAGLYPADQCPHSFHELAVYLLPWGSGAFHWPSLVTASLILFWSMLISTPSYPSLPFASRLLILFPAFLLLFAGVGLVVVVIPDQMDFRFQFRLPFMFLDFTLAYVSCVLATWGSAVYDEV